MFKFNRESWITAIFSLLVLAGIILLVSYFFVTQKRIIGPILILLGIISLVPIYFFKIRMHILKSDIVFGIIDNGLLAVFALFGAELFGILGAIVGGLVGNAITDGLAGLFEGYEWQKTKKLKIKDKRTTLTVSIGKLAGCLFGGGIVLTVAWSVLKL